MSEKEKSTETMKAKEMLKSNAEKERKIRYGTRKKIEIIKETKHFKVGTFHEPHTVMAEQLIKQKIAKEV